MKKSLCWSCFVLIITAVLLVGCGGETTIEIPAELFEPTVEAATPQALDAPPPTDVPLPTAEPLPTDEPLPTPPPDSGEGVAPTDVPPPPPVVDNNPELLLPFYDDFADGPDPAWRVINGRPLVVEGWLTAATNELTMEIGNTDLKNYIIELDISDENPDDCGGIGEVTFGFSPTLHYVYYKFYGNGIGEWFLFDSNKWENISKTTQMGCGHFRIVVNGSNYQIFVNGQLFEDIVFEPAEGPLLLRVQEGAYINNFAVTP